MSSPHDTPPPPEPDKADPLQPAQARDATPAEIANLEFKARLLLVFMLLLVVGSALYVMYARGAFESTQRLVLIAEDSEGVVVGMDLTFSGFPIGRVKRIELANDGKARILVDVAAKDAHWLRTTSVFTLVRGLVGSTNIRAYTGLLNDPPLPDGAERTVLLGDAAGEVPKVIAAAKDLIENLNTLTGSGGAVGASLANLQTLTERLNGPGGALTVLLGSEAEAKKFAATLERTNSLLTKLDGLAAKTDTQVFGDKGLMPETRATVVQLNAMLGEARTSLKKVDALLQDAQAVTRNAKDATDDLGALRADVEASLRKVEGLINEISRKWPFAKDARDAEMKLP
ncbi:MAG: MlaD family protein [Polaromonas sp.]|uniref:MlaD family protein n=1 Tax=Polaromonas sp. TaxID=1869339 RepID=UPI003263F8BB